MYTEKPKIMLKLSRLTLRCIMMCGLIGAVNTAVCKPHFKYHASTHTCMLLVFESSVYASSKDICRTYKGGPQNDAPGHLVYIFNEDTNRFVKVCKPHFKYHASTHTCMLLVFESSVYASSKDICRTYKGGPQNDAPGHLVYIFNEDTNRFVKDLLPSDWIEAEIGLNVYLRRNKYTYEWGDSKEPVIYFGWERSHSAAGLGFFYQNVNNLVAVISKNGWNMVTSNIRRPFICQTDADIELPTMICPVLLVGRPSPEIKCVIRKVSLLSTFGSELRARNVLASCNTTACEATDGYTASVRDDGASLSLSVNIISARRSDQGSLTCEWKFAGELGKLSTGCNITVHEPPTTRPVLIKSPNLMAYKEGDIIILSCTVSGGSPPVHSTTVACEPEIKDTRTRSKSVTENGNTASMYVNITVDMNRKSCECYANHESNLYNLKDSLTLSIIAPAKVYNLTFTNSVTKGNFSEVDADQLVRITCSASGSPTPSLSLYYTDFQRLLKMETGYQLIHSIITSCNDSGTYICVASNSHNETPHKFVNHLRVRCRPMLCRTEQRNPQYSVALNTNASLEMCVYAYPEPSRLYLYQGFQAVAFSKYSIRFDYTFEVQSRGSLSLTVLDIRQDDLGNFSLLLNEKFLPFVFTLVENGPPSCPKDIQVKDVSNDGLTLAWRPGHDGGFRQTFILLRHGGVNEVVRLQDTKSDIMEYNVTGLSGVTSDPISVDVENEKGRTECRNVKFLVTADALTMSYRRKEDSLKTYLTVAFTNIFTAICVASVFLVYIRRRKRSQETLLRQNNSLLLEGKNTRGNQSPAPVLDSTQDNDIYCECVPTEPNVDHFYQQIPHESSGHEIRTSTEDGYLLPNDCGPRLGNTKC